MLVADDEAVVRAGISAILDAEPDLTVVGQAADGHQAIELITALRPAVALMDLKMPGVDGIRATAEVAALVPETRVVVLSSFGMDDHVFAALRAGAVGFLLKDAEPERLLDAVRLAAAGQAALAPSVAKRLVEYVAAEDPVDSDIFQRLTRREAEVLQHLARGLSNAEIGAALGIGQATVKDHVAMILAKLGVRDRLHATIAAYEAGVVRPRRNRS
ncbi:DNA-binding response regulator [Spongiactinospora rosea]|uniref:DNA-binding response regulator n=1 Tax=Spongiactinospora rosea TaxID=2248750 RepID=A0A366M117_9ACTN|nr:DNA-binding response regulator [Spongiactinospora rosea]